jgi:head-tail adaptor
MISAGLRRHRLTVQTPGANVPDGRGGWTSTPTTLADVYGEIVPATVQQMEQVIGGAVQAAASHLVTIPYVPGVTVKSAIVFHDGATDRRFTVSSLSDPAERHVQLVCACEEVLS